MFDHVVALATCVYYFPQIYEKTVIRAWCATVSNAVVLPSIHKWTVRCWHALTLWLAAHLPKYHIWPEGSLHWWIHSLLQYMWQKCYFLAKESLHFMMGWNVTYHMWCCGLVWQQLVWMTSVCSRPFNIASYSEMLGVQLIPQHR